MGVKEEPDEILEIKSRDVPVRNGRVDSMGIMGNARLQGKPNELAKGYTLILAGEESATELDGFLFEVGGERLLGMQVSSDAMTKSGLAPFVLPLHLVLRPTVVGEELRLEMSAAMYAWMPSVGWIDAEPGAKRDVVWAPPPDEKPVDVGEKPTSEPVFWITSDVDRLIEVYEKSLHVPGFWKEIAVFRRVKE